MSVEDDLFRVGHRHHDALLLALRDLEAVALAHDGTPLPGEAAQLQRAVWPWLKAYGRRDHHGSVCEDVAPDPRDQGGGDAA